MFHSLADYADWYVESCLVLNKADAQDDMLSECGYDPTMRRLLEELIEYYSPLRFVTEKQFIIIYQHISHQYGEDVETGMPTHFGEDGDRKEELNNIEGMMSLYDGLFNNGQLCEPIKTPEMAKRLGVSHRTLVAKLNKFPPPVHYAWKLSKIRGDWRYDPTQIDNFKRWLCNLEDGVTEGPDVSSLVDVKPRGKQRNQAEEDEY